MPRFKTPEEINEEMGLDPSLDEPPASTMELAGERLTDAAESEKTMLERLAEKQAQLEAALADQSEQMGKLQQHNDQLQAQLNEQQKRRDEGLQKFSSDHLTENDRWKHMFSDGGLLG